ncbi:MAG: GTP-binding protein, partial [Anaerolineae bacterium]
SSTFEVPFDFKAFREAILALPISIYRAKGIVFFEQYGEIPFEMHMVGKRAMLSMRKDWTGPVPISQLVAIGELGALDANRLQALFESARSQGRPARGRVLRSTVHMTRR